MFLLVVGVHNWGVDDVHHDRDHTHHGSENNNYLEDNIHPSNLEMI